MKQQITVKEFLTQIAENEIINGKPYSLRIELNDGDDNSYIGLCVDVDVDTYRKIENCGIRMFRNANNAKSLDKTWEFALGDFIHHYPKNKDIPMRFESYGKTIEVAESEARQYFKGMKRLVHKKTSEYKTQMTDDIEKEKEQLLARLKELEK